MLFKLSDAWWYSILVTALGLGIKIGGNKKLVGLLKKSNGALNPWSEQFIFTTHCHFPSSHTSFLALFSTQGHGYFAVLLTSSQRPSSFESSKPESGYLRLNLQCFEGDGGPSVLLHATPHRRVEEGRTMRVKWGGLRVCATS